MRHSDLEDRLEEARLDIVDFMYGLTGAGWDVTVSYEDGWYIKIYGSLEFIEIRSDEWGDFFTEIKSRDFKYEDELLDYIYKLQL